MRYNHNACNYCFIELAIAKIMRCYIYRYKEISHRSNFDSVLHLGEGNPKSTIRQFFSSMACITCGEQTNKEICPDCLLQSSRTILILLEKIKQLERNHQQIITVSNKRRNKIYANAYHY